MLPVSSFGSKNKEGSYVCKDGRTTYVEHSSTSSLLPSLLPSAKSTFTIEDEIHNEKVKDLMDKCIKKYFKEEEERLEQPRKELYELTLKLNTLGYTNVFDKVSYYLQIHGNNIKSIENLKKEIKDTIQDKENMIKEYEQLMSELKIKYNINYNDNPLKELTKDFFYEKNAVVILKEKIKENKKIYTSQIPFFGQH